jgi:hypothetical protein
MKIHPFILWLFILCSAIFLQPPNHAQAQEEVSVYLKEIASSENSVTVEIIIENIADLYGMEYLVTFDPAALAVVDSAPDMEGTQINAGSFLPPEQGFVVANRVDSDTGEIAFAMTLLNPAPAASGSGSLGQITFEKLTDSATVVDIKDIKLVASSLQMIQADVSGLTIGSGPGGMAAVSGEGSDFPWWIVGAVVIVAGLLVLGVFLVLGGGRQSGNRPRPPKPVTQQPVRSRPSAFK